MRAAVARGEIALLDEHAHERLEAGLGSAVTIERCERPLDVLCVGVDRRSDELVLGLEVVVDVADRDVGCSGDVRERRPLDALLVQNPARGGDEPLALTELGFGAGPPGTAS